MSLDFDAGKYAFYVWTSFAITGVLVAWMVADSLARAAKWRKKAEALQAERDAQKAKAKP